jgi:hypothetical protein
MTAGDKHLSLLHYEMNYGRKELYNEDPKRSELESSFKIIFGPKLVNAETFGISEPML